MLIAKLFKTFLRELWVEFKEHYYPSKSKKNSEDAQFKKLRQELEILRDASAGKIFDL
jgi:hypothetical protein